MELLVGFFIPNDLSRFASAAFQRLRVPGTDADIAADSLVEANLRGEDSHGMRLLPLMLAKIRAGGLNPISEITIQRELGPLLWVRANGGLGEVIAAKCMMIAIERTARHGLAFTWVVNSSGYGGAKHHAMLALKTGMIGVALTSSLPTMGVPGSLERIIGNNPVAFAFPTKRGWPIVVDLAFSMVAGERIVIAAERGQKIPQDWAWDSKGIPTDDPHAAREGMFMPIGGYKGFALALVVELLTSVLGGGAILEAGAFYPAGRPMRTTHLLGAIKIESFMPLDQYFERTEHLIETIKSKRVAPGHDGILLPGERGFLTERRRRVEGIPLDPQVVTTLEREAAELGVPFPKALRSASISLPDIAV